MRMPLLNDLIVTYDAVSGHEPDEMECIAPVGHHYVSNNNKTVIDIKIDGEGNFVDAEVNSKLDGKTLLAVTEASCSRVSKAAATTPHALNDSLMFMTSGYYHDREGENPSYMAYIGQLESWAESEYSCPQVRSIYSYLIKRDPVDDLISKGKIPREKNGDIELNKFQKALVRWIVLEHPDDGPDETWKNKEVMTSWENYYSSWHRKNARHMLDALSGQICDSENLHPKAISSYGNSKLISIATKEDSTLHFKGERFNSAEQTLQIGYQDSQKIHNALGWLIDTQSIAISKNALPFEQTDEKPRYIVCWMPGYQENNRKFYLEKLTGAKINDTASSYVSHKGKLHDVLYGLKDQSFIHNRISVFMTDRSGDGRFSPVMYRSFSAEEYLLKLKNWYESCRWYFWNNEQKKITLSTPTLFGIVKCAYGTERISNEDTPYLDVNDSVFKDTVNTLLAVVLDGRSVPDSLVRRLTAQASAPERFSGTEKYRWRNWKEILNTACAVLHKYHVDYKHEEGERDLVLDKQNSDRSYLFGRLLAVMDRIENTAMNRKNAEGDKKNHRDTNAMRLWSAYAAHPYSCFLNLRNTVAPYLSSLPYGSRKFYEDEIQEIYIKLNINDKKINRPLDPEYLMGFYLERDALETYRENKTDPSERNETNENGQ